MSRVQSLGNQTRTTRVLVPCCKQCKMHLGSSSTAQTGGIILCVVFALVAISVLVGGLGGSYDSVAMVGFLLISLLAVSIGVGSMLLLMRLARKNDERIRDARSPLSALVDRISRWRLWERHPYNHSIFSIPSTLGSLQH